jgi:hypothetical protein
VPGPGDERGLARAEAPQGRRGGIDSRASEVGEGHLRPAEDAAECVEGRGWAGDPAAMGVLAD